MRRWILRVSLFLNLFLGAVIIGHVLHDAGFGHRHETILMAFLRNAEDALPASDAAKFHAVIVRQAPRYKEAAAELSQARVDVNTQFTSMPFDADATRAAIARWRQAWNAFVGDFSDTFVDAMDQISPEGRQKIISEIQKQRSHLR